MYILRIFTYILYQKIATVGENLGFSMSNIKSWDRNLQQPGINSFGEVLAGCDSD